MLNFNGDCDGDGHGVGTCKHTLTIGCKKVDTIVLCRSHSTCCEWPLQSGVNKTECLLSANSTVISSQDEDESGFDGNRISGLFRFF